MITWNALRDARDLAGLTQQQLAEKLGVSLRTIGNWETNGVPPKNEYRVRRELGSELLYIQTIAEDPSVAEDVPFSVWKEAGIGTEEHLASVTARVDAKYTPEQLARIRASEHVDLTSEQRQYEAQLQRREALAAFSDEELHIELMRRMQVLRDLASRAAVENVTELPKRNVPTTRDTIDHVDTPDLEALDYAAKRGTRKADAAPWAE